MIRKGRQSVTEQFIKNNKNNYIEVCGGFFHEIDK